MEAVTGNNMAPVGPSESAREEKVWEGNGLPLEKAAG